MQPHIPSVFSVCISIEKERYKDVVFNLKCFSNFPAILLYNVTAVRFPVELFLYTVFEISKDFKKIYLIS